MISRASRRWALWLAAAVVLAVAVVLGGTFVYIHFIPGPAPAQLSLKSPAASAGSSPASGGRSTAAKPIAGTWRVASGSVVGYRVKEVLFGQDNIAVGRTGDITGQLTISGSAVTAGSFTVQMATIKSDQSQRDAQFRGRIMDTAAYPTGTLVLTRPITLAPLPATGVIRTYAAAGLAHAARARPPGDLHAERGADQRRDRDIRLYPGPVRAVEHPESQLRHCHHYPEPRRARVPAQVRPGLTARRG